MTLPRPLPGQVPSAPAARPASSPRPMPAMGKAEKQSSSIPSTCMQRREETRVGGDEEGDGGVCLCDDGMICRSLLCLIKLLGIHCLFFIILLIIFIINEYVKTTRSYNADGGTEPFFYAGRHKCCPIEVT